MIDRRDEVHLARFAHGGPTVARRRRIQRDRAGDFLTELTGIQRRRCSRSRAQLSPVRPRQAGRRP